MDKPQDLLEAIEFMIDTNIHRHNRKEIACMLRPNMKGDPEKKVASAKAWFSNCLNPDGDQHFHPEDVDAICEITGRADIYINYLADKHGFERPTKKIVLDPSTAERVLRQALLDRGLDPDEEIKQCIRQHKPFFLKETRDK